MSNAELSNQAQTVPEPSSLLGLLVTITIFGVSFLRRRNMIG